MKRNVDMNVNVDMNTNILLHEKDGIFDNPKEKETIAKKTIMFAQGWKQLRVQVSAARGFKNISGPGSIGTINIPTIQVPPKITHTFLRSNKQVSKGTINTATMPSQSRWKQLGLKTADIMQRPKSSRRRKKTKCDPNLQVWL